MTRLMIALLAVGICVGGVCALTSDAQEKKAKKSPIKIAMAKAMKGGLCKKVASGKADDKEKEQLLKLFTAMAKATPPKGEADSWKAKTKALVDGAKGAVDGKEGAEAALGKAANCKACHDVHKK